jgi:hypothetical protein
MATDKGVVQGYTGVAAVDEKHQVIVEAQAHGSGSEQELLAPVVEALEPLCGETTVLCADSGYHSEDNLKGLEAQGIEGYIPITAGASAIRATRGSTPTRPNPMRCGTSAPKATKRSAALPATSKWPKTSPTVSARRASASTVTAPTATSGGGGR